MLGGKGMFAVSAFCAAYVSFIAAHATAQSVIMGAMGDSLTDEYAEGDYNYAKNWVQQLVMFRGVDFGPTASEAGQPGGTWGEPRRTQYEQNWARGGADSVSLLSQGQHTGLASQIIPYDIEFALLAIGANDFAPIPLPGYPYFSIYWNFWSQTQKQNYINAVANNIATAMDAVLAAGDARFILATVPDYGVTPIAVGFFPNADRRENVTAVIKQLNDKIIDLAEEREIVLLDVYGVATAIFGTNHNTHTTLHLGNVPIFLTQSDTSSNTNPQAGFVHDQIHPHTTLQGIFANAIMTAMNLAYGAGLDLFTEEEILAHAGLAYGGADTLDESIGDLAQYVLDFTPKAPGTPGDLNGDGVVDVFDLLLLLAAWGPCPPAEPGSNGCEADLNGDGVVDVFDLLLLLANWG